MEDRPLFRQLATFYITIAVLFLNLPRPALGQQAVTDFVYGLCNTATFTTNSTFSQNLNALMGALTQQASKILYSNSTVTSGSSNASYVYGMYQCRGDVSLSGCSSCVSNGLLTDRVCGSAVGGRMQYKGCYIRYENYNFLGVAEDTLVKANCSTTQDSNSLYQTNLARVLNDTATAAPAHALFGYNASSVGEGSNIAYALAQCVGYLSSQQCATCLSQVSNYRTVCNNSESGEVYFVTCYYLFDHSSFLFTSTPAAPIASISPYPAPAANTSTPTQEKSKTRSTTPTIVGVALGVSLFVAAVAAALALCFSRKRKQTAKLAENHKAPDAYDSLATNLQHGATKFSFEELREATDDFHPRNKLGEGGFGPVYKGTLKTGREVAIKMLSSESHQGKTEFMNEVNLITSVQHRNLIQLLGCSMEESKRLLVYEYLPNRSLDLLLFDVGQKDHWNTMDWRTRFDIIIGIARGLSYLHEDSHVRIVHRDIKTSNILLDNNLNPKIADFGLARLFADDVTHMTTRVAGTLGYLAPEYAINGQLTEKVDVYSFGLVALEIVSGRKVMEHKLELDKQHLLEWTWALFERQQQVQIVDTKVRLEGMGLIEGEVIRVVHVALLCTQTRAQARPSMSRVYMMLCNESEILERPTKPTIIDMVSPNTHEEEKEEERLMTSSCSTWPLTSTSDPSYVASSNAGSISEVEPR